MGSEKVEKSVEHHSAFRHEQGGRDLESREEDVVFFVCLYYCLLSYKRLENVCILVLEPVITGSSFRLSPI